MTNQEILNKLANVKNGKYISLTKVKDLGQGVRKESDMLIRLGVNYANMKINENKQTGSLPWGKWVEGLENLVVVHKGNYYLRVTAINPENLEKASEILATRYYKDGVEISKEEVNSLVKEKGSNPSAVYNIKFDNIIRLGN